MRSGNTDVTRLVMAFNGQRRREKTTWWWALSLAPGVSIAESGDILPPETCVFMYKHEHSEAISKGATVDPVTLNHSVESNPFLAIP